MASHVNIVNVCRRQIDRPIARLNRYSHGAFDLSIQALPDTSHGQLQPVWIHRFEQVIQRPGLEGANGVCTVSGDEDDVRHQFLKMLHEIQAAAVRQPDIEKNEINIPNLRALKRSLQC